MNIMLLGLRASLASTSTFLTLLLLFAAAILAKKQPRIETATCVNAAPLSILPQCSLNEARHEIQHVQLLKRIDRKKGKWDKKHPRWEILDALHAFDTYEQNAGDEIKRFEGLYTHVPAKHKKILESTASYSANFAQAHSAIKVNSHLCREIVFHGLSFYNVTRSELASFIKETSKASKKPSAAAHRSQVSQALKHISRDWSPSGHPERSASFPYILSAISSALPSSSQQHYSVLVPGAGLGSLAHEISNLGENVQVTSNEFSAYMNLAYRYLASFTPTSYQPITIHPFIEPWSHARTRQDLFRPIHITTSPSLSPGPLLVEGDFTALFPAPHQAEEFDCVATLFFIDTARDIVDYMERIYASLRPGGMWVNVGPLLYGTAPFVQLSLDEVFAVAESIGFVFEEKSEGQVAYDFGMGGLYRHGYLAQFWVARRPNDDGRSGKEGWW